MKSQSFHMWLWIANPKPGFPKLILIIRKVNVCLN